MIRVSMGVYNIVQFYIRFFYKHQNVTHCSGINRYGMFLMIYEIGKIIRPISKLFDFHNKAP